MTCVFYTGAAGVTVIACGPRAKPAPCASCSKLSQLLCDGCDKPLCAPCSVSPREGLDFCPVCCRDVFREWCATDEGRRYAAGHRDLRRNAFRAWAKNFAVLRLEALRTKASHEVEAANNGTLNAPMRRRKR